MRMLYLLRLPVKSDILLTESEKAYANRSWTEVDFVLYNKTTKHPILAIEVDGMAFHQHGSEQTKRDEPQKLNRPLSYLKDRFIIL